MSCTEHQTPKGAYIIYKQIIGDSNQTAIANLIILLFPNEKKNSSIYPHLVNINSDNAKKYLGIDWCNTKIMFLTYEREKTSRGTSMFNRGCKTKKGDDPMQRVIKKAIGSCKSVIVTAVNIKAGPVISCVHDILTKDGNEDETSSHGPSRYLPQISLRFYHCTITRKARQTWEYLVSLHLLSDLPNVRIPIPPHKKCSVTCVEELFGYIKEKHKNQCTSLKYLV